jgi:hypothetical protein
MTIRDNERTSNEMIRISNHGDMTIVFNMELVRQAIIEAEAKQFSELTALQHKRETRLSLVRERIRTEKEAMEESKKKEEQAKRKEAKKKASATLDVSEHKRRLNAYTRYTHLSMPTRKSMKERAGMMPMSAGLSVEDVDLLPWSHDGEIVNVAKMQKFVNEDYKKKFPRKKKVAAADR